MICCYGKIVYLAAVMRHRRRKWSARTQEWKLWEKNELRLLKVTGIMCATFLLFWMPYAVVAMIKAYASHIHLPIEVSIIPALAAKTSHVADPLIYCALNRNFSQHMPLLCRKMSKGGKFSETYLTTQSLRLKNLVATDGKINESSDANSV
ncbi:opsin-5 [Elysia marginata]|uniref:Opsin-5 n=1 Tax=Elysia marginata TaxID=1093978 RepID=A0AAV4FUS6_9GAST|nr:opsin-5 [Elysia marginata]